MPRTLAQNAQYIAETIKPAIKSAIEARGVTVPSTDSFLDYADRIGEIEGGGSGYQLKDLPTGSISTVNDAAELPLNALKVSVEAWQEGSGDPSPSNIRPIHGWDSGEIGAVGKNWLLLEQGEVLTDGSDAPQSTRIRNAGYLPAIEGQSFTVSSTPNKEVYVRFFNKQGENQINGEGWTLTPFTFTVPQNTHYIRLMMRNTIAPYEIAPSDVEAQFELGSTATTYEPYQGKQYTQQFPTTIYGAEWDVINGELGLKITDGFYESYNGESLPGIWMSDRDVYQEGTTPTIGAEVKYKLATPTYVTLTGLSIRLLEGTNNLYANCGEVIEGEYFVDEGALDTRKVDYSIGSNTALKISDGRILQGFARMYEYGAFPLDVFGNWLDVDWSKDFEMGIAFKLTAYPTRQTFWGDNGTSGTPTRNAPRFYYNNSDNGCWLCLSTDGDTLAVDTLINFKPTLDKWYFIKLKFVKSTMALTLDVSEDFSTYTNLYSGTLSAVPYHLAEAICVCGESRTSNKTSNTCLIDTFNTYIKGDGVNWGAFTGVFPR